MVHCGMVQADQGRAPIRAPGGHTHQAGALLALAGVYGAAVEDGQGPKKAGPRDPRQVQGQTRQLGLVGQGSGPLQAAGLGPGGEEITWRCAGRISQPRRTPLSWYSRILSSRSAALSVGEANSMTRSGARGTSRVPLRRQARQALAKHPGDIRRAGRPVGQVETGGRVEHQAPAIAPGHRLTSVSNSEFLFQSNLRLAA